MRFNLDPQLLRAIAAVESGHRPEAVNGSHAARTGSVDIGLMQINTGWLPRLSRYGIGASDLKDACTSIEIGAWILSDLVQRHGNEWEAVGAYNAACSQLKGAACIRARADYAWKVYRRLHGPAKGVHAKAASASTAHAVLPGLPAAPGLMSVSMGPGKADDTGERHMQGTPQ